MSHPFSGSGPEPPPAETGRRVMSLVGASPLFNDPKLWPYLAYGSPAEVYERANGDVVVYVDGEIVYFVKAKTTVRRRFDFVRRYSSRRPLVCLADRRRPPRRSDRKAARRTGTRRRSSSSKGDSSGPSGDDPPPSAQLERQGDGQEGFRLDGVELAAQMDPQVAEALGRLSIEVMRARNEAREARAFALDCLDALAVSGGRR